MKIGLMPVTGWSGKLDRVHIENPVLSHVPENGPVPVETDRPDKRPETIPLPSVRMLDWCDGGLPISDLAEAGAIEPDADPARPRDEAASARPEEAAAGLSPMSTELPSTAISLQQTSSGPIAGGGW